MLNNKLMKLKRRWRHLLLLGLALLVLQTSLMASPLVKRPLAPPDTSSPQATLSSFVDYMNIAQQLLMESYDQYLKEPELFPSTSVSEQFQKTEIFFNRAADCLDLSAVPPRLKRQTGLERAIMLQEILDRIELPPDALIPDAEAVAADKKFSRWRLPYTKIDIVKVESGSRAGEFLFSSETVGHLKEFYQKVKNLPYRPGTPEGLAEFYLHKPGSLNVPLPFKLFQGWPSWLNAVYGQQTLWKWIGLIVSLLIAFLIPYSSFRWNWRIVAALDPPQRTWLMLLPPIIALGSVAALSYFIEYWLNLSGNLLLTMSVALEIILWLVVAIIIFLLCNALAEAIIASPKINAQGLNASALRTFSRLLGLSIGIVILSVGIERVGISLLPILAGLGIGGLALALAARPTLENMIAGIILLADRPVKVGERCRFGEQEGDIVAIGLRSTRILGLSGYLISMPNSKFSELQLTNKSRSERILIRQLVQLRYETTPEQLRFVLANLRSMILAHPRLIEKRARVRLIKYGNYSFDVEIYVYVDTGNREEFRGIQEDVLLRVIDIVKAAGTGFAFPSQTTYLSRDRGLDSERSQVAEAEVQGWRSKGMLPFPEFPPEERDQLRNTLDFPPKGSPNERSASDNGNKDQEK